MKLVENNPVATLFGDEPLPAAYHVTLAKILNDNLVLMRIQDEVHRYFGALAISRMAEWEAFSLKKRITLLLAQPGATDRPGELNHENVEARIRRHNTGDHSECTPDTCYIKAHPPAPAPIEAPVAQPVNVTPQPAPKWHVNWYLDLMLGAIVAEVPGDEKRWFSGKPEDAGKFKFRNETCPPHIIAQYERLKTQA
jgi:hypothetical protein